MADSPHAGILIVDDDSASLMAMEEVLRSLGSRLVTARSGEEALRRVLDEDFAAILMDVRMPGIDGFTTARMIRERKRCSVIARSASSALSMRFMSCRPTKTASLERSTSGITGFTM